MWIEVNTSSLTIRSLIRIEVFVVVAVPRHEGDQAVAAERQFAEFGRRTVGDNVANLDRLANLDQRALVDAGRLVRALEFLQRVNIDARLAGLDIAGGADDDAGGIDLVDNPATQGGDRRAGIAGNGLFHAGADERRLGPDQRHRLALHVRAHQRAVGVVVLEERNQRGGDRDQLLGTDVHQGNMLARRHDEFARLARGDQLLGERAVGIELGRGLGDGVLLLFHRRKIDDVAGHLAIDHLAVGRFDEAVFVDPGKSRKRVDQADVRPFRRLDRADAAIVGRVNVAHFEAGALTGEAARPERRNAALVGDF